MKSPSRRSTRRSIQALLSSIWPHSSVAGIIDADTARINHAVYTYDQFKPGLQYARSVGTSIQDEFSVILQWENAEQPDGVVAVLSKWTTKDKATGKEIKKTNVILWEVKFIDGKRMLTGQTEVETV